MVSTAKVPEQNLRAPGRPSRLSTEVLAQPKVALSGPDVSPHQMAVQEIIEHNKRQELDRKQGGEGPCHLRYQGAGLCACLDLAAVTTAPGNYGFAALFILSGVAELAIWKQDDKKEPGNFGDPLGLGQCNEDMRGKELNNGRMAMIAALGIVAADIFTGKDGMQQLGLGATRERTSRVALRATAEKVEVFQPAKQMGARAPLGFFDPVGFTKEGDESGFRNLRAAEIKHGRVAMMAAVGAVAQHYIQFPGFEGVPADLAAVTTAPGSYGFAALFILSGVAELAIWKQDDKKEPGNFGDPLGLGQYNEDMRGKELNNGRMAMIAALGIVAADIFTGKDGMQQLGLGATRERTSRVALRATAEKVEVFQPAKQMGATAPLGFFDPVGFTKEGDESGFRNLRAAEIKHGRVAMMAAVGAVAQHYIQFPGFEGVPADLAAVTTAPGSYGFAALFILSGVAELAIWKQDDKKEPGNFGDPLIACRSQRSNGRNQPDDLSRRSGALGKQSRQHCPLGSRLGQADRHQPPAAGPAEPAGSALQSKSGFVGVIKVCQWQDFVDLFDTLPPGSDEVVALTDVLQEVKKEKFDRIIIDTAPTGHALRLLSYPDFLERLADRVARLRDKIRSFQFRMIELTSLFTDPERVTIPTTLAMEESKRLLKELEEQDVRVVGLVIANRILDVQKEGAQRLLSSQAAAPAASSQPSYYFASQAAAMGTLEQMAERQKLALTKELLESKDFEELLRGGFSKDKLMDFFSQRPLLLARRVVEVGGVLWNAQQVWKNPDLEATRGEVLRKGLVQLGPVFVKVGQTLAQRADIVGAEFARELKSLQMDASPFSNEYAHRVILEDLDHRGPLAPDLCPEGCDPSLPPLFASISRLPVAAASLGQVYQARTHEGLLLAVKVQRPGVARSVALDWACLYLGTGIYRAIRASFNDFTVLADQIATGVFLELDYHHEGNNIEEFVELHRWLGFVAAP
ncbi:unnamed protein product, partial [Polarella glacialis]